MTTLSGSTDSASTRNDESSPAISSSTASSGIQSEPSGHSVDQDSVPHSLGHH